LWGFLFAFEVSWFTLGASYEAKHIWDGVIETIEHRLAWKMMYLSMGGRVTLIESKLSNMPM
jgi:hypothetical protein